MESCRVVDPGLQPGSRILGPPGESPIDDVRVPRILLRRTLCPLPEERTAYRIWIPLFVSPIRANSPTHMTWLAVFGSYAPGVGTAALLLTPTGGDLHWSGYRTRHLPRGVVVILAPLTLAAVVGAVLARLSAEWMGQIVRNFIDIDEALIPEEGRFLIHDRDPLSTRSFRVLPISSGIEIGKLPARCPNLNAYVERFVLSTRSECLAQVISLRERHLRHVVKQ